MLKPADTILHYQILDLLAKGGMGQVYRARDTKLDREVALKFLLNQDQADPEQSERLVVEAKAVAKLDHNNIANLYTIEEHEGQLFLAMALYEGESLEALLSRGALTVDETLALLKQILKGLSHAHQKAVIHRDIKPANIFVTGEGQVKILDFGLARLPDSNLTQKNQMMGTPSYTSPEQLRAEGVDHRTDIWSLGVLIFQMLTGDLPFAGKFPQVMVSILKEDPKPLRRYLDHQGLENIIGQCLAKDKRERFESCEALLAALSQLEPGSSSVVSVSASTLGRQESSSRRRLVSFVGRDQDVKDVISLLTDEANYLVTIAGIGGAGKTSLAKAVMMDTSLVDAFPDGCHFVALDALQDAGQIPAEVAQVLGVDLSSADGWAQLPYHFENKTSLLILDNLEQLIDDCAAELEALLEACPGLSILATSREVLNIEGEVVYQLKGLSLPPDLAADFDAYGATELFILKAKRFKRSFEINQHKAAVFEICQQLEGWPLGIDLAVAWIKQLTAEEIARQLKDNLDLLISRSRSHASRHQSARAAFEYSWNLLSQVEQEALTKLAVFQDGFTTEAAIEVAAVAIQTLAALLDKSLITLDDQARYNQHPLLHQFCTEKLAQRDDAVKTSHARYYLTLAERAYPELVAGHEQAAWLACLAKENQNFVTATQWTVESEDVELAMKLVTALHFLREQRVDITFDKTRTLVPMLLSLSGPADDQRSRALLLKLAALYEIDHGNIEAARALLEEGLAIGHALDDALVLSRLYNGSYNLEINQADYDKAKEHCLQSLHYMRLLDDQDGISLSLNGLGEIEQYKGNYVEAESLFAESVAIARASGNKTYLAMALRGLGFNALLREDYDSALKYLQECKRLYTELGSTQEVRVNLPLAYYYLLQNDVSTAKALSLADLSDYRKFGKVSTIADTLRNLGHIAIREHDLGQAIVFLKESCQLMKGIPGLADALIESAILLSHLKHYQPSLQIWASAETARQHYGFAYAPYERVYYRKALQQVREALSEAEFEQYWQEGTGLTLAEATSLVMQDGW